MDEFFSLRPADRLTPADGRSAIRDYMALRLAYVHEHGWLPDSPSDHDRYDDDPDTWYFVRTGETDGPLLTPPRPSASRAIAAGLRITRVPSVAASLTWDMLAGNPSTRRRIAETQAAAIAEVDDIAADPGGGLWDVTRLVSRTDGAIAAPVIIQSLYELFGMAIHRSVVEPDADPVWLCLTTETIKRLFDLSGFPVEVLFRGEVTPGDGYDCLLCLIRPKSAFDAIRLSARLAHRRAYKSIRTGCDALAADLLPATGTE